MRATAFLVQFRLVVEFQKAERESLERQKCLSIIFVPRFADCTNSVAPYFSTCGKLLDVVCG